MAEAAVIEVFRVGGVWHWQGVASDGTALAEPQSAESSEAASEAGRAAHPEAHAVNTRGA